MKRIIPLLIVCLFIANTAFAANSSVFDDEDHQSSRPPIQKIKSENNFKLIFMSAQGAVWSSQERAMEFLHKPPLGAGKTNPRYCQQVAQQMGLNLNCFTGAGQITTGNFSYELRDWKVVASEYVTDQTRGRIMGNRVSITDSSQQVNATFTLDNGDIRITQVVFPMAYQSAYQTSAGNLSVNRFYQLVDALWHDYALNSKLLDGFEIMNKFIADISGEPGPAIDRMLELAKKNK